MSVVMTVSIATADHMYSLPALEERNVEESAVVVNELEEEHLECEAVLILRVSPRTL